ncbi:MAG: division/cell wall cluster transcriptional repressor MraZ [Bacteroidota bacterium]
MANFVGDYNSKMDARGRVVMPSSLKKQLSSASETTFVIKKDIFEKCLLLYPMKEWERQNEIIRSKVNPYNKEHNQFLRGFYRGTAQIELDANNRLLIPKRLTDLVGIDRELVFAGQNGRIEIWASDLYERMEPNEDDFAALAEKIMGGNDSPKNETE